MLSNHHYSQSHSYAHLYPHACTHTLILICNLILSSCTHTLILICNLFHPHTHTLIFIYTLSCSDFHCLSPPHVSLQSTAIRRPLGYCAPYNGRVCRKHLSGGGLVWYNITANNQGGWLNEHITKELWAEMIENFREPCRTAAEVSWWLRGGGFEVLYSIL